MKNECYSDSPSGHTYNVLYLHVVFTQNTELLTLEFAGVLEA